MKLVLKALGVIVVLLAVALGVEVTANRVPDVPAEQLKAKWAPPPSQFVAIAGMQVHLRDEGPRDDATPIVLLHGTSSSLHTWEPWVLALKDQHRVISYDMPGFGLTGPAPDNDYRIERFAATVVAVLDKLGVQKCVLAGNSLGGYTAWATAVLYPDRVAKLVLIDAGGYAPPWRMPLGWRIARNRILFPIFRDVLPRRIVEGGVREVFGNPSKVTPALVDRYFAMTTRAGNRDAVAQRLRQVSWNGMAERVHEIKAPTLILWGQLDPLYPASLGERFHKDIAGSEVKVFDGLGHVPQEEDPATTVAVFKDFVNK